MLRFELNETAGWGEVNKYADTKLYGCCVIRPSVKCVRFAVLQDVGRPFVINDSGGQAGGEQHTDVAVA